LNAVFATQNRDVWLDRLVAADVPAGPLHDLQGVFNDPQVEALKMVAKVPHPAGRGDVALIRNAVRMSDTPPIIKNAAPQLGQHNAEILKKTDH
jgi:crotonobetainyl-CoA:carnitine CoA-transferase CaiB-like acyl-CoA transferase